MDVRYSKQLRFWSKWLLREAPVTEQNGTYTKVTGVEDPNE